MFKKNQHENQCMSCRTLSGFVIGNIEYHKSSCNNLLSCILRLVESSNITYYAHWKIAHLHLISMEDIRYIHNQQS
jgi:hypothetical protein